MTWDMELERKKWKAIIEEAYLAGQLGIVVMHDKLQVIEHGKELRPGTKWYNFILDSVSAGEDTTFPLMTTKIVAVPVEQLRADSRLFNMFLQMCKEYDLRGPVYFLPSNVLSRYAAEYR